MFRYHPDPFKSGVFHNDKQMRCECCEQLSDVYYDGGIYCIENIEILCPDCIASGRAAEKFDGYFVSNAEGDSISDQEKHDELFKRTPSYISWQGEHWLSCCQDYCAFLGDVGTKELEEMGIADEVFAEYDQRDEFEDAREYLVAGGSLAGYLFQCLHCKKYHLWVDAD